MSDEWKTRALELFQDVGGVSDESGAPEITRKTILAHARQQFDEADRLQRLHANTLATFPPSRLFFLRGNEANAFAIEDSERGFIGLKVATIVLLDDYFRRILALPSTFAEIGDPTKEEPRPGSFCVDGIYRDQSILGDRSDYLQCTPRCKDRARFALMLTTVCLDFLFHHEIAHIRMGHCRYARDLGVLCIQEAAGASSTYMDPLTQQTFELEADIAAVAFITSSLWTAAGNPANAGTRVSLLGKTPDQVVTNWAFAVFSLWRILSDFGSKVEDYRKHSHPHPVTRQIYILDAWERALQSIGGPADLLRRTASLTIGRGEEYYGLVCGSSFQHSGWSNSDFEKAIEAHNALVEYHRDIEDELAKYRYMR